MKIFYGFFQMKYTVKEINKIAEILRKKPLIERQSQVVNKQGAIHMLAKEIDILRKKNYSLEEIADMLTENNLPIGHGTLKSYLHRIDRETSAKRQSKKKQDTNPEENITIPSGKPQGTEKIRTQKQMGFDVTLDDPQI